MKGRSGIFRSVLFSVSIVLGMLISSPLLAQVDMGSIQGTVLDQSGAVIPNAKVSLTNEATNLTVATQSNASGAYIFTPIRIGTYTVTAEAPGFAKFVQAHATLNVQQQLVVNLTLKPGAVTQTIEVTGAPPALQTQNASVGQVVDSRSVNNLPLNGRNFTFLAQIVAGVNTPQADTRGNAASGAFSANGERPSQNDYLLDGIDNNSNTIDFLNGTNYVVLPPIDAVQEFKVQTSNYSAEIGRAGGAVLNATIKSGSNQLHGDVWEFLRNDKLDAADFFENVGGVKKGEYRQNQFGFTLGGPIVIPHVLNGRDKLFFFGDYEALRRVQGSVFTNSVPTDLQRGSGYTNLAELITYQSGNNPSTDPLGRILAFGTVLDPATTRPVTCGSIDTVTGLTPPSAKSGDPCFQTAPGTQIGYVADPFYTGGSVAGITDFRGLCTTAQNCQLNQIPLGRIDPNAVKILNLFPAAQLPGIVSNNTTNPPLTETRDAFDGRIDWNLSNKDQIFTRASFVNDPEFIPGPFQGVADGGAFQQGPQTAMSIQVALGWTKTLTPTAVNEARVGETYLHTTRFGPVGDQLGIPEQFGILDVPQVPENGGLPAFVISGLSTLGSNAFLPSDEVSQTTQVADNFTKVYGKHTYKMGFEFQHIKFSTLQPSWSHGEFDYNGDFAGGGNNAIAQFLLTPITTTVPNGVDYLGGASEVFTSNIALVDDLHNYYAAYFNDDWKLAKKLTLNLGLRWEHFGLPLENHGRQANFIPGTPGSGAEYLIPDSEINRNFKLSPSVYSLFAADGIAIKFDKNWALGDAQNLNFAPRFGFAYQVTPKLVARGGFGVFFGGFENQNGNNQGNSYPYQFNFDYRFVNSHTPTRVTTVSAPGCANVYTFELGFSCTPLDPALVDAGGIGWTGLQHNFQTPYTEGWNMSFEYAFTPSLTLTAGYVGNTTRHLQIFKGANNVTQILAPDANTSGPGAPVLFPDLPGGITYQTTDANSYYNGLQTTLEKRFSGGLNFLTTYTWSRCRSDGGDLLNGGSIGSYRAVDIPGAGIQADYGDCDFDIRHVIHLSGGYDLPFGKGRHFMTNASRGVDLLLGGWSTQWLSAIQGGQPITLGCTNTADSPAGGVGCYDFTIPGVDRHGSGAPDNFLNAAAFTQPCPPPGFNIPARCIAGLSGLALLGGTASQVSGPGIITWDFSMFKNIPLTERFHLQFRSEFFNILNHPTFNAPGFGGNGVRSIPGSTDFLDSNFGKIGSTRFPFKDPRQIQFALKLYF